FPARTGSPGAHPEEGRGGRSGQEGDRQRKRYPQPRGSPSIVGRETQGYALSVEGDLRFAEIGAKGSAAELERRRTRAVELIERGEAPGVVARILGIDRSSLYRWPDGLAAKPHPGPTPALSDAQLGQLEDLLLGGATAHGWANDLWTAPRVTV